MFVSMRGYTTQSHKNIGSLNDIMILVVELPVLVGGYQEVILAGIHMDLIVLVPLQIIKKLEANILLIEDMVL